MNLVSLNCNHCGAPLDAPESANFVTCSHCSARLSVERTGSTYSTSVLEAIHDDTNAMARDIAAIKQQGELEQLDREWATERSRLMLRGKYGRTSTPTKTGAILIGVIGGTIGLALSLAGSIFGIFMLAGCSFYAPFLWIKAENYEGAYARYSRKRQSMLRDHTKM